MKGIILAGGTGTRLHPATLAVNKLLTPVYEKPMIYYPLFAPLMARIRDILVISLPEYIGNDRKLFGDGLGLKLNIAYAVQPRRKGWLRPSPLAKIRLPWRQSISSRSVITLAQGSATKTRS